MNNKNVLTLSKTLLYNRIRAVTWFTIHTDWINPLTRRHVRNRGEG